jgi:hypothetical protein
MSAFAPVLKGESHFSAETPFFIQFQAVKISVHISKTVLREQPINSEQPKIN